MTLLLLATLAMGLGFHAGCRRATKLSVQNIPHTTFRPAISAETPVKHFIYSDFVVVVRDFDAQDAQHCPPMHT